MPVELPSLIPENEEPTKPSSTLWFGIFMLCMMAGLAIGIIQAPSDPRDRDAGFWFQLFGTPALVWGVVYGFRRHYYDTRMAMYEGEVEARQEDFRKALAFARDPLAVLGFYYLCALGEASTSIGGNAAQRLTAGESAVRTQEPRGGDLPLRHSRISEEIFDATKNERHGYYRTAYERVLDRLADEIRAVPRSAPFSVKLCVSSDDENFGTILDTWQECWRERGFREVDASALPSHEGIMDLERWLDIPGGAALERFVLFVAAEVRDAPPEGSGEAIAALLLSWAPLALRRWLTPVGFVHRPVAAVDGIDDAVGKALLWGNVEEHSVKDLWDVGIGHEQQAKLLQLSSDVGLGLAEGSGLSAVHALSAALGNTGAAGEWLALALATEHARDRGTAQLITSHPRETRFFIVKSSR